MKGIGHRNKMPFGTKTKAKFCAGPFDDNEEEEGDGEIGVLAISRVSL